MLGIPFLDKSPIYNTMYILCDLVSRGSNYFQQRELERERQRSHTSVPLIYPTLEKKLILDKVDGPTFVD